MIDNFSIIFFGILIMYFVFKAIKLDKILPWFQVKASERMASEEGISAKKEKQQANEVKSG